MLISAIALAVSWAAVRAGDDRFLEKEAISSADNWARFLQGNLTGHDQLLATGQLSAADRALFQRATDEGHVFRYKVFGSDGRIVFGLRAIDLGQPSTNAKFAEIVKAGRSLVEIERKEDFGQYCIVSSEAYIPITNGTDFQGAIEVYVDMTDRAAAIRDLANLGLSGLLFLLVVLEASAAFLSPATSAPISANSRRWNKRGVGPWRPKPSLAAARTRRNGPMAPNPNSSP